MSAATETAYQIIRKKLIAGDYDAGAHLNEVELSDLCNVSRTPIREAIRRLAGEYFVKIEPNRGAFVVDWTRGDVGDHFELRAMFEGFAARKAAHRATKAQINDLAEVHREIDEVLKKGGSKRTDDFISLNRRFHDLMCEASGNARMFDINGRFVEQAVIIRTAAQYTKADLERSNRFHVEITDAIRSRNAELADQLMRTHILSASALYRDCYLQERGTQM